MANLVEVKVPDIGDFTDIPVIEILVKVGDTIKKEDSLVSLESDKATMEVPSSHAGVVKEIKVKLGDKVSMGSPVLVEGSFFAPESLWLALFGLLLLFIVASSLGLVVVLSRFSV